MTNNSAPPAPRATHVQIGHVGAYFADDAQAILDRCTGVYLASTGRFPIAASHRHCHGAAAWLDLREGDVVTLAGGGADGTYRVIGTFTGA
ncbi:hypothetical protein [Microbacterium sp. bgisy203]|uniref:hypothetical protein n=1 Tax=Microbacterium sp. bgisy203 TaxID=3413799 RepID=UPI003D762D17